MLEECLRVWLIVGGVFEGVADCWRNVWGCAVRGVFGGVLLEACLGVWLIVRGMFGGVADC